MTGTKVLVAVKADKKMDCSVWDVPLLWAWGSENEGIRVTPSFSAKYVNVFKLESYHKLHLTISPSIL